MAQYVPCATLIILCSGLLLREGKGTREETNKENNTMTWAKASHFCESKNTSLVDPFDFVNTSEGTFWTNRRMKNVSYVTYIAGCVNTSHLSQINVRGRKVSFFWQCHNLCSHTDFFGIQNSTCFCLSSTVLLKNDVKQHLCIEENKDVIGITTMRIQNGSTSDFMTIYGNFTVSLRDPIAFNCLTISCATDKKEFRSIDCSNGNFKCVCNNGVNKSLSDSTVDNLKRNWIECFVLCNDNSEDFSWIPSTAGSSCDEINYHDRELLWIAAIARKEAENDEFCYRCHNDTFNCQYAACNESHFPYCIKNELFSTDAMTTIGLETVSAEVKRNFNDTLMTCFHNKSKRSVDPVSSTVPTNCTKTSDWIHILGCVNGKNEFSRNFTMPYPSVILCEDECKASEYFLVKDKLCLCIDLPIISYTSEVSACNIPCKDSPHLGISCGGNDTFSLFKSSKDTLLVEDNFSHSCVALSCGTTISQNDTKHQWFPENCMHIFDENHCIAINGSVGSTMNGTWANVRKGCVQKGEYLPANISLTKEGIDDLCTRLNMSAQQWIGVVRLELTMNFTGGEVPDPSSIQSFQCKVCRESICQLIKCNRTNCCDTQTLSSNNLQNSTVTTGSTTEGEVFRQNEEQSKNDTDLQILVPVGVAVVAIATCLVVFLTYRYRKRKGKPNNRFVQVHFQNEYVDVVKSCTREENRRNEASANASQDDPAYIDSKMDVYDRLGEKHLRHLEQSEYLYSHTGSSDSQYGDVSVAPSDDTYDHTKPSNTSNAEYDSCTRY